MRRLRQQRVSPRRRQGLPVLFAFERWPFKILGCKQDVDLCTMRPVVLQLQILWSFR